MKNGSKGDPGKEKAKLDKEISSILKIVSDYKVERKANWTLFKNRISDDILKLKRQLKNSHLR